MPNFKKVSATILLFALFTACFASGALAQSSDVSVTIPEGIVAVHGTTSPHAQVKIYENGNSTPAASLVADSSGDFSEELPQMTAGIVTLDIQATDTNGVKTPLFSRQIAIMSHQTSILNALLPPSIAAKPSSIPFGNGSLSFVGRTTPDAIVKVVIGPSSTVLTASADSRGDFTIPLSAATLNKSGVYTYSVQSEKDGTKSDLAEAGTFTITPPALKPTPSPRPPFLGIARYSLSQPVITWSSGQENATSEPVVLTGTADPDTVVMLYEDDKPIGSIAVDKKGKWQFYFVPYKEKHTIYAKACRGDKCSILSDPVTIKGPGKKMAACQPLLTLQTYRLTSKVGGSIELRGTVSEPVSGLVVISWGEGSTELLDFPSDGQLNTSHIYQETGTYSGFVIVNNGTICQTITHFTAEIIGPTSLEPISRAAGIAALVLIVVTWIFSKALPALRNRAFIKK